MNISQTYGYRLGYSQQEWTTTQTVELPDNAPREAVRAESILLGAKVRLEILSAVYEYGEMDNEEFSDHLHEGFREQLVKAKREMDKLFDEDKKIKLDADGEPVYVNYEGFISDLKYVRDEVRRYEEMLEEEEE